MSPVPHLSAATTQDHQHIGHADQQVSIQIFGHPAASGPAFLGVGGCWFQTNVTHSSAPSVTRPRLNWGWGRSAIRCGRHIANSSQTERMRLSCSASRRTAREEGHRRRCRTTTLWSPGSTVKAGKTYASGLERLSVNANPLGSNDSLTFTIFRSRRTLASSVTNVVQGHQFVQFERKSSWLIQLTMERGSVGCAPSM